MPITKRQLGFVFMAGGALGFIGVLLLDLVRHHPFGGAFQWATIAGCALAVVMGAALLPLGNRPA